MEAPSRGRAYSMIPLLGYLVVMLVCTIIAYVDPTRRVWLVEGRIGDDSHPEEKFATKLFTLTIGIAGCCLSCKRPAAGLVLVGACDVMEAVRFALFEVWEDGRLIERRQVVAVIYLMLGLFMFWAASAAHRRRQAASESGVG